MSARGTRRATAAAIAALAGSLAACDLGGLLDVRNPGRVPAESLADPALAATLARGVVADLECAWNNYVAASALLSDQLIPSSANGNQRNWASRRVDPGDPNFAQAGCDAPYGIYTPLQTARFQAEDVFMRISAFPDAAVPNKTTLLATVRAYGAYALVALGEGFCDMAIDVGPLMQPRDVLRLAEQRFTEAIELATRANARDILNMALVGRARVRLDLESFQGAVDDAARVPSGFVKNATRDELDVRRYNALCEYVTCQTFRHASVAPNYRALQWRGAPDPRVRVTTTNRAGHDGATIHFFPADKFTARGSPEILASYREAQLVIAEAAARTGDLARTRAVLSELHRVAGIAGVDVSDAPTQDDLVRLVIEERRRELFLEGGHRLNDHLRFRGTRFNIPFKGEPGSIHPAGVDQAGVPYGPTTCFPLPTIERNGNPNIPKS